ncbi:MAG: hypothetical protein NC541_08740 [bacterium]|nr:hypothetical protein [bacterium]
MTYEYQRKKAALRRECGIKAFRILKINGNRLTIRNPVDREKVIDLISVRNPGAYKSGDYIDVIFNKTGVSSYVTQFLGDTPPEFAPTSGEDIS